MSFKNIFVLLIFFGISAGAGFFGSVVHKERVRAKDYFNKDQARFLTVRVSDIDDTSGGSGVIVKPGPNGLARVLTNGHVCDAISVFPEPEEYYKMSLKQSLLLPVKGKVFFDDGKSALITRILKHADLPDLCLVEVNRQWPYEYAKLAKSPPMSDTEYFSVGYPIGQEFVLKGELQRPFLMVHPARIRNPAKMKRLEEIKKEQDEISKKIIEIALGLILMETSGEAELAEQELDDLDKKIDALTGEFKKIIRDKHPSLAYSFTIMSIPGSSGSGIWNDRGELVALIWGRKVSMNTAYAVPLPALDKFLTPRLSW